MAAARKPPLKSIAKRARSRGPLAEVWVNFVHAPHAFTLEQKQEYPLHSIGEVIGPDGVEFAGFSTQLAARTALLKFIAKTNPELVSCVAKCSCKPSRYPCYTCGKGIHGPPEHNIRVVEGDLHRCGITHPTGLGATFYTSQPMRVVAAAKKKKVAAPAAPAAPASAVKPRRKVATRYFSEDEDEDEPEADADADADADAESHDDSDDDDSTAAASANSASASSSSARPIK